MIAGPPLRPLYLSRYSRWIVARLGARTLQNDRGWLHDPSASGNGVPRRAEHARTPVVREAGFPDSVLRALDLNRRLNKTRLSASRTMDDVGFRGLPALLCDRSALPQL